MAGKKIKTAFDNAAGTFTPKINQAVDTVKSGVSDLASGAKNAVISIGEFLGTGTSLGQMASSQKNMAKYTAAENYYGGLLEQTEANKPGDYQESEELVNMRGELKDVEALKPDPYVNKYEDQIDGLIDTILGRDKFSYDYSTDPMWQTLSDQYQRNAVLGMQSAMGEASGLTGGYASSYAQQAGQQAYQQNISEMTDIIPELAGHALNTWQAENQQLASNLAALQTQSEIDYAQYYNDWQMWNTDRNYMYQKVMDMSDDEFNKYMYGVERWNADRNYYAQQKQIAIQNQQWQLQLDESRRQFNNQMAFNYINMGVGAAVDLTTTGMQVGASLIDTGADFALGVGGLMMDKYEIDKTDAYNRDRLAQENEHFYFGKKQEQNQFDAQMDYNYAGLVQDDRHFGATMDYNYAGLAQDDRHFGATMDYNYAALAQDDKQHQETLGYDYYKTNLDNGIIGTQSIPQSDVMNEIPKELRQYLNNSDHYSDSKESKAKAILSAYDREDITEEQAYQLFDKFGIKY